MPPSTLLSSFPITAPCALYYMEGLADSEPWLESLLDPTAFPDISAAATPQPAPPPLQVPDIAIADSPSSSVRSRPRPRRYRPRNNRSCDFCRKRKSACIVGNGPHCGACVAYGRECTFDRPLPQSRRSGMYPCLKVALSLKDGTPDMIYQNRWWWRTRIVHLPIQSRREMRTTSSHRRAPVRRRAGLTAHRSRRRRRRCGYCETKSMKT